MEDERVKGMSDCHEGRIALFRRGNTLGYVRYSSTISPAFTKSVTTGWTRHRGFGRRQIYVVADHRECRRTLHSDGYRSRRPRARPDLRLRHHRHCRRAVGPPLDHDRHLARRARAGPRPHHGRALSVLPARRLARGPAQGSRSHPHRAFVAADARQHPPGLRLRARAAHHAQVHRQQRRDRRHLGEVAGDARAAAREAERRARRSNGRSGRSRARPTPSGRTRRRSSTPTGGRRASRGRRRSTPPSPPRRSSSTSTTSRTTTRRRCASPAPSPSRASRRTACSAWTRTTS